MTWLHMKALKAFQGCMVFNTGRAINADSRGDSIQSKCSGSKVKMGGRVEVKNPACAHLCILS